MKNKKNIATLLSVVALAVCAPLFVAHATVTNDPWKYVFYVEERGGVLAVNRDEKWAYDVIPMEWGGGPSDGAYYGEIVSGRGVSLAKVWFPKPTMVVEAKNKNIADISAPYFANADHVSFYSKDGVFQFKISLEGSSFCNDNNKCDEDVGENYYNCVNDCARPDDAPVLTPAPPQASPLPPTPTTIEAIPPTENVPPIITEPEIVRTTETPGVAGRVGGTVSLVGGVFLILTAVVGFIYTKKKGTTST